MSSSPRTNFVLPDELSAREPVEARGVARDDVRLLVAAGNWIEHASFREIGRYLRAGDLLIVNTSATLAAAVDGTRSSDGMPVVVHFSTLPMTEPGSSSFVLLRRVRNRCWMHAKARRSSCRKAPGSRC